MDNNVPVSGPTSESPMTGTEAAESALIKTLKKRIVHTLEIYPKLSHTMLAVGIGTSVPSSLWREILEGLEEEGVVKIDHIVAQTPTGRMRTYALIQLADQS